MGNVCGTFDNQSPKSHYQERWGQPAGVVRVEEPKKYRENSAERLGVFATASTPKGHRPEDLSKDCFDQQNGNWDANDNRELAKPTWQQSPPRPPPQPTFGAQAPVNWTRGELIGAGAFGRVYLGLNNDNGQLMAVKQVAISKDESVAGRVLDHLRGLEAEVNVLSQLDHPNIVRYLGTDRTRENLNIFLEFVPGGSIASLLAKFGSFKESVIKVYTRQILLGLEYLHKHQIMHRDIKGANILVDNTGLVKLADFGASKKIEDLVTIDSGFKSMKGTPYWMAPEVIKQTGHGRQADIWSVGCTVIEMATGKPPWSHIQSQVSALFHIASSKGPPPIPESVSPEAKDFLLLCFNRVPKDRPNATRLLLHPFLVDAVPRGHAAPLTDISMSAALNPALILNGNAPTMPSPIAEEPEGAGPFTPRSPHPPAALPARRVFETSDAAPDAGGLPAAAMEHMRSPAKRRGSGETAAAPLPPPPAAAALPSSSYAADSLAAAGPGPLGASQQGLEALLRVSPEMGEPLSTIQSANSMQSDSWNPVEEPSWMQSDAFPSGSVPSPSGLGGMPYSPSRLGGMPYSPSPYFPADPLPGQDAGAPQMMQPAFGNPPPPTTPQHRQQAAALRQSGHYSDDVENREEPAQPRRISLTREAAEVEVELSLGPAAASPRGKDEDTILQFVREKARKDTLRLSMPFRESLNLMPALTSPTAEKPMSPGGRPSTGGSAGSSAGKTSEGGLRHSKQAQWEAELAAELARQRDEQRQLRRESMPATSAAPRSRAALPMTP